jgi:hypothetical protein
MKEARSLTKPFLALIVLLGAVGESRAGADAGAGAGDHSGGFRHPDHYGCSERGLQQNNYSASNVTRIPTFVTPFGISNSMTFSLLPNANAQATDGFSGSTTVTASGTVPEPANLSIILAGAIPLAVFNWIRRRRHARR